MRTVVGAVGLVFALVLGVAANAKTISTLDRRVVSASLFKNGLAVVTEEVEVPGAGAYRMEDPPVPLYGTLWVSSSAEVEIRASEEQVVVSRSGAEQLADLQGALAGRRVELTLRGDPVPVAGTVAVLDGAPADVRRWDREYRRDTYRYWFGPVSLEPNSGLEPPPVSPLLVLTRDDGTTSLIERSSISRIDVDGGITAGTRTVRTPVLFFDVKNGAAGGAMIRISYLTKGMAWVPSYRVDLSEPEHLSVTQQAVVRNELRDLVNTEIRLVTGFPNVPFGHVVSPLSPTTTWSTFFQQLDRRISPGHDVTLNVVTQQAVAMPGPSASGGALPEAGLGEEGLDLYEHCVGRRDLAEGESLAIRTGGGIAPYERVVDWVVPDTRRADGRQIEEYERRQDPERYDATPWDAVRFANPLGYPMTTGVATIVEGERFQGQTLSHFTNPGAEVTLRITRALSVATRASEHEVGGEREIVNVAGRAFRVVEVAGELSARNHRGEAVTMIIRRRFSGELIDAEREPSKVLLEEGVFSVNRRNELVWSVDIPAGDVVSLKYRYRVLVNH